MSPILGDKNKIVMKLNVLKNKFFFNTKMERTTKRLMSEVINSLSNF